MQRGHVALPNGLGVAYGDVTAGVAPNELTATEDRDPFVGTPWHKHVPARVKRLAPGLNGRQVTNPFVAMIVVHGHGVTSPPAPNVMAYAKFGPVDLTCAGSRRGR